MSSSSALPFETLLQMIAQTAPQPWYPVDFVNAMGVPRERLDRPLDQLRMAGLIALTKWVAGKGQGYELTSHGADVLRSPRSMAGLRRGYLPQAREIPPEEDHDPHLAGTHLGRGDAIRKALLNREKPRLSKILIIINLIVFVAGLLLVALVLKRPVGPALFQGDGDALHMTGSVSGADIVSGEWWRLLTCCFVHFGGLHLAMNMYSLWVLGTLTENVWGRPRFLTIYILAGLGGSCAAMWYTPEANLAGASGAIWGIMLAFPTWLILNRAYLPPKYFSEVLRSMLSVILLNVFISFIPGISKEAHFGGGLVGAAAAALLNLHRYETRVVRWFYIAGIAIIPLLCVGVLIRAKHSDVRWLDVERQGFKQKLGGVIRDAREEGRKALRAADNYRVDTPTEKWERAKVDELLDQLKTAQKKLSNAEKECEQAGPFNTQRVRTAVTAAHKALSKQRAVLEHLERCLEAGVNWTRDEEDQLKKAADEMNEARAEYERILSGDE